MCFAFPGQVPGSRLQKRVGDKYESKQFSFVTDPFFSGPLPPSSRARSVRPPGPDPGSRFLLEFYLCIPDSSCRARSGTGMTMRECSFCLLSSTLYATHQSLPKSQHPIEHFIPPLDELIFIDFVGKIILFKLLLGMAGMVSFQLIMPTEEHQR